MRWSFDADRPIYIQLKERVKTMIAAGEYPPGERLPTVRELAEAAAVNPNTVQRAFSELERDGLIITQRTSGRIVTEDEQMTKGLRHELADAEITRFLDRMREIGVEREEAVRFILEKKEEAPHGDS